MATPRSQPQREDDRTDLASLDAAALTREVTEVLGERPFRARQIFRWINQSQVTSFDEMTDLSKALRARLIGSYRLSGLEIAEALASRDGTVKFRFLTRDGRSIESVYLPEWKDRASDEAAPDTEPDRRTLCVSSQVGCAMGCTFCATATLGLVRNLTPGEMAGQVHAVNRWLRERGAPGARPLTNLVFMGMGEPLHNYENLKVALDILLSVEGPNFSHRHVTVSTSGLVPTIRRFGDETEVKLAISLTGTTDAVRNELMPVNRRWNIETLMEACRRFPMRQGRRITFEYVLIDGRTDTQADADRLAHLLRGIPAKVNLIAYNEGASVVVGGDLGRPADARVQAFRERLVHHGVNAVVRRSRGRDIAAACGQLAAQAQGSACG